ncbi:MAG: CCA tRNA nucleotidyltransferase [Phormidesmis sp.]
MSLFAPEVWPFSLDLLPVGSCLVGGSVRDRLLNRQPAYLDLDFVVPERSLETAQAIAQTYGAGFVVLDAPRQIARVVFDQVTVDFAQQQGESLEADLRRRDFTINAIAYYPHQRSIFDPLGGQADLASNTLRMVSDENLRADPLRLMRAYRQAAQLGFKLTPDTRSAIYQLAPNLQQVSIERVHSELDALLSVPFNASRHALLQDLQQSQLLQFCLPHFTADSAAQVLAIDGALSQLQQTLPDYAQSLQGWHKPVPAGFHRSWIKAAKLSRLLCPKGAIAQAELDALKYSRSETQVLLTLLKMQDDIEAMQQGLLGQSQQFFLFKRAGESFPALSLLALSQGVALAVLLPLIERFLDADDAIAHSRTLVDGNVLIEQLGMKAGPAIGAALRAVERAQAAGEIGSKEEAIAWILNHHSH